ncbi:MAG: LPS export ABC transporter permease LptG [Magnetospirillum sp. WYHS-4]
MRISVTLSLYIGRQFLLFFLAIMAVFLALILLFDTVELMRRSASVASITLGQVVEMSLMKLPNMSQQTFPFAVLFGGMAAFAKLTRSHELVVTRAAGVSAWQFLLPILFLAFCLGLFKIAVFNPVASATLARYERLEASYLQGQTTLLSLAKGSLWLRQSAAGQQAVVYASRIVQSATDMQLVGVTIFVYDGPDRFARRIEARSATLEDGFWHLREAGIFAPEEPPQFKEEHWLETDLTLGRIQDSFSRPETMSFWALPGFIDSLEQAGFSAVRHRLHLHALLASPLLMCAMVLIAATFSLRHTRKGGTPLVIAGGVFTGFVLYFFSDVVFALGIADSIPVTLAAWTPSGVSTLLGLAMLLHLEDG